MRRQRGLFVRRSGLGFTLRQAGCRFMAATPLLDILQRRVERGLGPVPQRFRRGTAVRVDQCGRWEHVPTVVFHVR
jgi:hypothetical protein